MGNNQAVRKQSILIIDIFRSKIGLRSKNIKIEYDPTKKMAADFLTKL